MIVGCRFHANISYEAHYRRWPSILSAYEFLNPSVVEVITR